MTPELLNHLKWNRRKNRNAQGTQHVDMSQQGTVTIQYNFSWAMEDAAENYS